MTFLKHYVMIGLHSPLAYGFVKLRTTDHSYQPQVARFLTCNLLEFNNTSNYNSHL